MGAETLASLRPSVPPRDEETGLGGVTRGAQSTLVFTSLHHRWGSHPSPEVQARRLGAGLCASLPLKAASKQTGSRLPVRHASPLPPLLLLCKRVPGFTVTSLSLFGPRTAGKTVAPAATLGTVSSY